jgi:hypothetical protein
MEAGWDGLMVADRKRLALSSQEPDPDRGRVTSVERMVMAQQYLIPWIIPH